MERLDENSVRQVLSQVGPVLRALVEENVKLASALKEAQRAEQAEEIVTMMDARGLSDKWFLSSRRSQPCCLLRRTSASSKRPWQSSPPTCPLLRCRMFRTTMPPTRSRATCSRGSNQ